MKNGAEKRLTTKIQGEKFVTQMREGVDEWKQQ